MNSLEKNLSIRPALAADLPVITEIYNEAVLTTDATMDTQPRTPEAADEWFHHYGGKHPLIVAELDGAVAGWGSLSEWSGRCGYAGTVELSFYVKESFRGRGIGRKLLESLVAEGKRHGHHNIVSRISAGNASSIHLHEAFGFANAGVLREVGFKFGRWVDVVSYQLLL